MDKRIMLHAATLCQLSYDPSRASKGVRLDNIKRVDQYRLSGEFFGCSNRQGGDMYVVFRGTDTIRHMGNWFFTNFQVYRTPFAVLDPQLNGLSQDGIQACDFASPVQGTVHQGFYRAMSMLWYGREPALNRTANFSLARVHLIRGALIVLPSFLLGLGIALKFPNHDFAYLGAILGLLSWLVLIGFERGTWEGLVMKSATEPISSPLRDLMPELQKCRRVWFVGHSLGGAIAILAFALYRRLCQYESRTDNGYVITFGAPRLGDKQFHADFENHNPGRFWNVIAENDPVPHTPPSTVTSSEVSELRRRGMIGAILADISTPWRYFEKLYSQQQTGEWSLEVALGGQSGPLDIRAHDIGHYLDSIKLKPDNHDFTPRPIRRHG